MLSLALHTPSVTSTSTHFFVSDDAVTSLCCVEVELAPMQDELFTAQVNESKHTSEQEVNHHHTHCETICFPLLVCVCAGLKPSRKIKPTQAAPFPHPIPRWRKH